jgi:hypothetical protein
MSTLNGQSNDHDEQLLHAIEQIVQQEVDTTHVPYSPLGFGARLAGTVPQPGAAFAERLEARLVAQFEQGKEASAMNRVEAKPKLATQRFLKRNNRGLFRPALRIAAVCLATLMLTVSLLAATPPVQAGVERMLQRFGLVLVDPTAPTPVPAEGNIPNQAPAQLTPQKLSLAEAQQQVPFPIRLPTWLPNSLTFAGITVGTGGFGCSTPEECATAKPPVWVSAGYHHSDDDAAYLAIEATEITSTSGGGYVVSASEAENVVVNGQSAVYIRGTYRSMLSWKQDSLTYVVITENLNLSREDMIRIAESLR